MSTILRANSTTSLSSIGSDNVDVLAKGKAGLDAGKNKNMIQRTRDALGDIGNRIKKNQAALGGKNGVGAVAVKKETVGAFKGFAAPAQRAPKAVTKPVASIKPQLTIKNEVQENQSKRTLKVEGRNEIVPETNKENVAGRQYELTVKTESTGTENEYNPQLSSETTSEAETFSSDRLNVIVDIDKDEWNPLLVQTYVKDIYDYVFALEKKYPVRVRYLEGRLINSRMRAVLLDWLVEVHIQFSFMPETLYMTAKILDLYLQADRSVTRKQLQLVGATAMYVAAKYEEVCTPAVQDFAAVCDNAFTVGDVLKMEETMLNTLSFDLAFPPAVLFLRRFSKAANATLSIHAMAKYVMEVSLIDYAACNLYPSERAAGSLALALVIMGEKKLSEVWNATVQHYTRYTFEAIKPIVSLLAGVVARAHEETNKLKAVHKKYTAKRLNYASIAPELLAGAWKNRILKEVCKM